MHKRTHYRTLQSPERGLAAAKRAAGACTPAPPCPAGAAAGRAGGDRGRGARLVKAVAEHGHRLVAQQPHERLQVVQLLVRAHADAQAADGVHAVLRSRRASLCVQ